MAGKALLAVVIIIALAVISYFFFLPQQEDTFEAAYNELKHIWKNHGIDIESTSLTEPFVAEDLSDSELVALKSSLREVFGKYSPKAFSALVKIHLKFVDYLSKKKAVLEKKNEIDLFLNNSPSDAEICDNFSMFSEQVDLIEAFSEKAIEISEDIEEFNTSYPEEAEIVNFGEDYIGVDNVNDSLSIAKTHLSNLTTACFESE